MKKSLHRARRRKEDISKKQSEDHLLDEIGEISPALQANCSVLQEKEIVRLGTRLSLSIRELLQLLMLIWSKL